MCVSLNTTCGACLQTLLQMEALVPLLRGIKCSTVLLSRLFSLSWSTVLQVRPFGWILQSRLSQHLITVHVYLCWPAVSYHILTCVCLVLFKDGPAVLTAYRINLHSGTGGSEALCDACLSVLSSRRDHHPVLFLFSSICSLAYQAELSSVKSSALFLSLFWLLIRRCLPVSLPITSRCLCLCVLSASSSASGCSRCLTPCSKVCCVPSSCLVRQISMDACTPTVYSDVACA